MSKSFSYRRLAEEGQTLVEMITANCATPRLLLHMQATTPEMATLQFVLYPSAAGCDAEYDFPDLDVAPVVVPMPSELVFLDVTNGTFPQPFNNTTYVVSQSNDYMFMRHGVVVFSLVNPRVHICTGARHVYTKFTPPVSPKRAALAIDTASAIRHTLADDVRRAYEAI